MGRNHPVKNPDIVSREEEKEALLFNPADGRMMCINGTAVSLWNLCDGAHSIGDIVSEVTEKYEVDAGTAEKDCRSCLEDLERAGFLGYKV